ncbi:MAG: ATPase, T2SS/T4P/T4SS family [Planctomycetota bacterium]
MPSPSAPHERGGSPQLGQLLLQSGRLKPADLERALAYKNEHNVRLGQALVLLGLLSQEELIETLRRQGRVVGIVLSPNIVDTVVAQKLAEKEWRKLRAIGVNRIAKTVTVAMEDPSDIYTIDELSRRLEGRVMPVFAERASIEQAIASVFARCVLPEPEAAPTVGSVVDRLSEAARVESPGPLGPAGVASGSAVELENVAELTEAESDAALDKPVINLVRGVLEEAYTQGASDIHLEPRRDDFLVRFRVDGSLIDRTTVPKSWSNQILARVKVLANLDIAQRRLPQDGRAQFLFKGQRVDLRVATSPTLFGEAVVLRILDGGRKLRSLESLGLQQSQREALERVIEARDGFVLATGPTGSGKTTTLYALLQRLNKRDTKIITLEDPVENELAGVSQINANPKVGLTFATGLRSILRQDPDVILVGEIRDRETAEIAVQSALTGHLVLSTLHTVGAVESISRLTEMGIEPFLLADTLRGLVAQRLLRKICSRCKHEVQPDERALARLRIEDAKVRFFEGTGCDECHQTGYKGRIGIYEVLTISESVRQLIMSGAPSSELRKAAAADGVLSLREDGLAKARAGQTTLKEVLAETGRI